MSATPLSAYTTLRTEGTLLPADILARIASGDTSLGGLDGTAYHLGPSEKIGEATNRSWNRLQGLWANFQAERAKLAATDTGTTITRERWLLPLFEELKFGRLQIAQKSEIGRKSYNISHGWQQVPIHLVGCQVDLDHRALAAGVHRSSPHCLVQEFLNRIADNLWGIVSNGLTLRLLRDNISLTRQAYVEFDLESMMDGESYPDFVVLWLLLHQSRFEGARPEECQLEKWTQAARTEGVRVLEDLRDGVQKAIEQLGQGLLAHPANYELKAQLRSGALERQEYYRQVLRLVYRMLFLFVAEDRDLLLSPDAQPEAKRRYDEYYATSRLRRLATLKAGTRHHDLYCGLKLVMSKLADDGCAELALPPLGSFLFSPRAIPALNDCEISNVHLLGAIRSLAVTHTGQGRRIVDFKNLGAEELGSVYESLLELHPEVDTDAAVFQLKVAAGSERKKTGSYYTPTNLIACLLDSALEPVLAQAANQPNPEAAILRLTVIDPACGSGHFLIAAAHRISKRLAAIRTGEEEPAPSEQRKALHDVIGHCIYGLDVNPMAVELCKISLWLEALEPGKPLSFLDHHIQPGNSLIGSTPELLTSGITDGVFTVTADDSPAAVQKWKAINRRERRGREEEFHNQPNTQRSLQFGVQGTTLDALARARLEIELLQDSTITSVHQKEERWRILVDCDDFKDSKIIADAWCAAFFWRKDSLNDSPITEEIFRQLEQNPRQFQNDNPFLCEEIRRLAATYQFFHWHLVFPEVFQGGGFDVVIGNPPWSMTEEDSRLGEEEELEICSPAKQMGLTADIRRERTFFGRSRRFPYSAQNRLQTARLFAELFAHLASNTGYAGMIVPSTLTVNAFDRPLWQSWIRGREISCVWDFVNVELLFTEVYYRQKFSIICLTKAGSPRFRTRCWMANPAEVTSRPEEIVELGESDLARYSGSELSLPHFRRRSDLVRLERAISAFGRVRDSASWTPEYVLLGATNDREFVKQRRRTAELERDELDAQVWVPVYEGKMVGLFDHRLARVVWKASNAKRRAQEQVLTDDEKANPLNFATPLWMVPRQFVASKDTGFAQRRWDIALCDVTSALNERTAIAAIVPFCFATHNLPLVRVCSGRARESLLFLAVLGSIAGDYFARLRVVTNHLTEGIFDSLPIPPVERLKELAGSVFGDEWAPAKLALELSYTSSDLRPLAEQAGWDLDPFVWNSSRRARLQAEINAFAFCGYGFCRADIDEIMEDFGVLKRREERLLGEYRSKTMALEMFDAMQAAITSGVRYKSVAKAMLSDSGQARILGESAATSNRTLSIPKTVPDKAWSRLRADLRAEAGVMVVALLKAIGEPLPSKALRLATAFALDPQLLLPFLSGTEADEWRRVVGGEADPPAASGVLRFAPRIDQAWGAAVRNLRANGHLIEDLTARTWAPGTNLDQFLTAGWPDGRASFVLAFVREKSIDMIIPNLPVEVRAWIDAAAA